MSQLDIVAATVTDVGLEREHNEDYAMAVPELGLYIVCDGMGGHASGEVASKMTAESVERSVRAQTGMLEAVRSGHAPVTVLAELLRTAITKANDEVHGLAQSEPEKRGMGTTCTALIVCNNMGVLGHVGDSQLHLLREGQVTPLSLDHTFVAEAVRRGAMTAEQAAISEHANILMRSIGPRAKVTVDTLTFDIVLDDVLVLCSDGLSQYLETPQELAALRGKRDPEEFARNLITVANARGGSDNTSVIVLESHAAKDEPSTEPDLMRRQSVIGAMDTLHHVDVMTGFSMQEMFQLRQVFVERAYEPDQRITIEGDHGTEMFVLIGGEAEVVRGTDVIATLGPGAHFGEMALLNDVARVATVRAVTACTVLACERDQLAAVLRQNTTLGARFYLSLAKALSLRLTDVYSFYSVGTPDTEVSTPNGRTTMFHGS